MMVEIASILETAIEAGQVLTVKYHGGSQPGKERQISPISLSEDRVRARCYTSNAVKVFMLDKIELCEDHLPSGDAAWSQEAKDRQAYRSLGDLHTEKAVELERMGYFVKFEDDTLTVHRRWKNGKPLKGPEVSLSFREWTWDEWIDQDENGNLVNRKENKRKSVRPFGVWSKKHSGTSFKALDKAAARFLEWAKEVAPADTSAGG